MHPPRLDSIYNGADDDGSGTVAVLEIAEAFANAADEAQAVDSLRLARRRREGTAGAREYFTDHPTVPRDSIVAQLNIDMIGRGAPTDIKGRRPGATSS